MGRDLTITSISRSTLNKRPQKWKQGRGTPPTLPDRRTAKTQALDRFQESPAKSRGKPLRATDQYPYDRPISTPTYFVDKRP